MSTLNREILNTLDGRQACSSEIAHYIGRKWERVWEAIQILKHSGLIALDVLRGRWELTAAGQAEIRPMLAVAA
jgi:predicted transcriptional regulator